MSLILMCSLHYLCMASVHMILWRRRESGWIQVLANMVEASCDFRWGTFTMFNSQSCWSWLFRQSFYLTFILFQTLKLCEGCVLSSLVKMERTSMMLIICLVCIYAIALIYSHDPRYTGFPPKNWYWQTLSQFQNFMLQFQILISGFNFKFQFQVLIQIRFMF